MGAIGGYLGEVFTFGRVALDPIGLVEDEQIRGKSGLSFWGLAS